MLQFDPQNPFPLLPENAVSYVDAQRHSAKADQWLELRTQETEEVIQAAAAPHACNSTHQQLWIGLPVQALLTPYTELRSILHQLNPTPGETVVDLGAGYGRMGFVIQRHHPGVRFIGYEFVSARVDETRRCLEQLPHSSLPLTDITMKQADLSNMDFKPIAAQYYFLYDYGSREAIEKTLDDLREIARKQAITVVGRGRASRDAIERQHPWLSQIIEPRHHAHYSIYRSA